MAVDITLLFRASVKTVKTRNKALGVAVGGGGVDGSRDELFRRSPRPKGDFSSRAREVVSGAGCYGNGGPRNQRGEAELGGRSGPGWSRGVAGCLVSGNGSSSATFLGCLAR